MVRVGRKVLFEVVGKRVQVGSENLTHRRAQGRMWGPGGRVQGWKECRQTHLVEVDWGSCKRTGTGRSRREEVGSSSEHLGAGIVVACCFSAPPACLSMGLFTICQILFSIAFIASFILESVAEKSGINCYMINTSLFHTRHHLFHQCLLSRFSIFFLSPYNHKGCIAAA